MNYFFTTGAERIAVLEDIRKPDIYFPAGWDAHRTRQRESRFIVLRSMLRLFFFTDVYYCSYQPTLTA